MNLTSKSVPGVLVYHVHKNMRSLWPLTSATQSQSVYPSVQGHVWIEVEEIPLWLLVLKNGTSRWTDNPKTWRLRPLAVRHWGTEIKDGGPVLTLPILASVSSKASVWPQGEIFQWWGQKPTVKPDTEPGNGTTDIKRQKQQRKEQKALSIKSSAAAHSSSFPQWSGRPVLKYLSDQILTRHYLVFVSILGSSGRNQFARNSCQRAGEQTVKKQR